MKLFDRKVQVDIGNAEKAVRITDLHVTFKVTKKPNTGKAGGNSCTCNIYNLAQDTRHQFKVNADKIYLRAGYGEIVQDAILFSGTISNLTHSISKPDVITTLTCDDGLKELSENFVSLNLGKNTPFEQALDTLIRLSKLDIKTKDVANVKNFKFLQGFQDIGSVREIFNTLMAKAQCDWSVQNGKLKIIALDGTDKTLAQEITPETGMIGSLERLDDVISGKGVQVGWRVKCLLMPALEPGSRVILNSTDLPQRAAYKILEVEHSGDTHGTDWTSTFQAVEIK